MRYGVWQVKNDNGQPNNLSQGSYTDINEAHIRIDRWKNEDRNTSVPCWSEYEVREQQ